MKFTAGEEYGLRCLLQLARRWPGDGLTLAEMSRLEGLTVPHVAKLLRILRRGGFVKSVRGQAGGYTLARAPEAISLSEVLSNLGGRLFDPSYCDRHTGLENQCAHTTDCSIRSLLKSIQLVVDGLLEKLTLKDLLPCEAKVWVHMKGDDSEVDDRSTN